MGVICQIYLQKPPDGKYRPGSVVSGTVKYAIDKDTVYKDITISLIGKGKCSWSESRTDGKTEDTYQGTEKLVSIQNTLLDTKLDSACLNAGVYSHPFQFLLPNNIPPSYKDYYCLISYQIILKFERPGLFNFAKTFKTDVPVVSAFVSSIPEEPTIYELRKSLFQLFSSKKSVVYLKATVKKLSVVASETVAIDFEIDNRSKIIVTCIKVVLVERVTYKANCGNAKWSEKEIKNCKVESDRIGPGGAKISMALPTTLGLMSIQNSKVLSRDYRMKVILRLPMPHIDASLDIPIIIGDKREEVELAQEVLEPIPNDPPPSYWEVMAEMDSKK